MSELEGHLELIQPLSGHPLSKGRVMASSKNPPPVQTSIGNGGETHQRGGEALTTNHGVPVTDNQNSSRRARAARRCWRTSSCARRSSTSTTSASPSASSTRAARPRTASSKLTEALAELTRATLFTEAGKQHRVFVRFSTVAGGAGSVDTPRDVRGFAVKFYTKEGNWDLVGNNIPVFFIQDAIKFPDLVHAVKMEADRGYPQAAQRARHLLGLHRPDARDRPT